MASVRIEGEAFSDVRIEILGNMAGYNRYEALGRLAHLWRVCTSRNQHVVSDAVVAAILGEKGVDALLDSELGERVDGGIRVKGTKGRIEWLAKLRKNGRKGGRPKKTRSKPDGFGLVNQEQTRTEPESNPLILTPVLTPTHEKEKETGPTESARAPESQREDPLTGDVAKVIAHYVEVYPRRARQTRDKATIRKIRNRLEEGYSAEEICSAIDRNARSEFHVANGHTQLELIVRSSPKLEQWLSRDSPPKARSRPLSVEVSEAEEVSHAAG